VVICWQPGTAEPVVPQFQTMHTKRWPVLQVAHGYRRPIPLWFPPQLGALIVECWDEDPDRWALQPWSAHPAAVQNANAPQTHVGVSC
jgi:hypothetical protein